MSGGPKRASVTHRRSARPPRHVPAAARRARDAVRAVSVRVCRGGACDVIPGGPFDGLAEGR